MTSITDVIGHYQRSIEKSANDEVRLLHCIEKLYKLPVTVEHLQQTGIGKTVNSLRKYDKEVGVAAKALVTKWKAMVAAEEKIPEDEDIQRENGNDHDPSSNGNRNNENNGNQNSQNGNYDYNSHKQKHSSSQEDKKNSNVNAKDKRCKENRSESSNRYGQLQHVSHERKQGNHTSIEYNRDKSCNNGSDKNAKENHDSDKHHSSRRREEKCTSSDQRHLKKADLTPEPSQESPSHMSDVNLYDDEDEDEEKLIIDTELSKERGDESSRRFSPKSSSKASSYHKSNSKSSKSRDHKNSEHHSHKGSKTSDKNKEEDSKRSVKKSSTSSSPNKSEKLDKVDTADESRHHKSSRKDQDKDSHRRNGEHKSSSSPLKNKHGESSRDEEKKSSGDKSSSIKSSSKNENKKGSKDNRSSNSDIKKSSKRKQDRGDESSSDEAEVIPKKAKKEIKKINDGGIDSSMGSFSFEEALGLMAPPASKSVPKLKSPKTNGSASSSSYTTTTPKQSTSPSSSRSKTPPLLTSKVKLEPLDPKLSFELPTISPNYKPLPLNPTVMECVFSNNVVAKPAPPRRTMTDDEALQSGIQSKTIRTKIYSGVKTGAIMQVPTLHKMCIRVLQKNIDALEYTGGIPFYVLKSVLEHATPEQLLTFEEFNQYLLEDTDDLWKVHCSRRYKTKKRLEMESWREMFLRCKEEQDQRLNMLTKNITYQQKQITAPIKRTQLAYVDMDVKPPRNVQRKQEQYGTKFKMSATPAARVEALSKMAPSVAKAGDTRLRIAADMRDNAQASIPSRPKKAPLMQKTLQLMKGRFKR